MIENTATSYIHGTGPIVVKMLIDIGVDLVLAYELGCGADALLKQHNVKHLPILPKTKVRKAVELAIHTLKKKGNMYEILLRARAMG